MNKEKLKELFEKFAVKMPKEVNGSLTKGYPILWFGDLNAYAESKCHIVTIALNPSCMEFVEERFVGAKIAIVKSDFKRYGDAMNKYFKANPYKKWFNSYNQVINYLGASYGGKMTVGSERDTAIHLDFVPIATCPKWSDLPQKYRKVLIETYLPHLKEMLGLLDPDIIIMSVNKCLVNLLFEDIENQRPINEEFANDNNYIRYYRLNKDYKVDDKGTRKLIWGRCRNVPFGAISKSHREKFFKNIK